MADLDGIPGWVLAGERQVQVLQVLGLMPRTSSCRRSTAWSSMVVHVHISDGLPWPP